MLSPQTCLKPFNPTSTGLVAQVVAAPRVKRSRTLHSKMGRTYERECFAVSHLFFGHLTDRPLRVSYLASPTSCGLPVATLSHGCSSYRNQAKTYVKNVASDPLRERMWVARVKISLGSRPRRSGECAVHESKSFLAKSNIHLLTDRYFW